MKRSLEGLKALVTGATGGIGRAIVEAMVEEKITVIATGRDRRKLDELAGKYPKLSVMQADLQNEVEINMLSENSLKQSGGLDILINNAGVGFNKKVVDLEPAEFDRVINVNLRAAFLLSRRIGKAMAKRGTGDIINIGSGASTTPIAGMAAYCASKHALLGFSESLALEMRSSGVKVSIVMPGSTATHFGGGDPQRRSKVMPGILMPEDVADTVMCLLHQSRRAWTSRVNLRPLNPEKH